MSEQKEKQRKQNELIFIPFQRDSHDLPSNQCDSLTSEEIDGVSGRHAAT